MASARASIARVNAPRWWRERGLKLHWAWVPTGAFGVFAAWYEGGWLRVAIVLLVAVGLIVFATRKSKRS